MQPNQLIFVDADDAGPRRTDLSALFFNRKAILSPPYAQFLLQPSKPPPFVYDDPFAGVVPKLEYYSQVPLYPASGTILLYRPASQVPLLEPEPDPKRQDPYQYFTLVRRYAAQMVGFETQMFDHWDTPWQEEPPRPKDPQLALFPFRQVAQIIRGQPWLLYYGQPKPPYVEAEPDTLQRKVRAEGLLYIVANPPLPPVVIVRVRAVGIGVYDYRRILLALGADPKSTPATPFIYGPGDVFDILSGDFSDSTIDYSGGAVGKPEYGWMQVVPPSTPLSRSVNPLYDFASSRRTVY
jgi:hypothetical protein